MQSQAATPEAYLAELPPERAAVVAAVRDVILEHLPAGYHEAMNWGMITYEVPLTTHADTYNGQPLGYVGLAAQKRHYALYLYGVYADPEQEATLRAAYDARGRKPDLGKSCLRFKRLEDVPLDTVGRLIASTPPEALVARYEAARQKG